MREKETQRVGEREKETHKEMRETVTEHKHSERCGQFF